FVNQDQLRLVGFELLADRQTDQRSGGIRIYLERVLKQACRVAIFILFSEQLPLPDVCIDESRVGLASVDEKLIRVFYLVENKKRFGDGRQFLSRTRRAGVVVANELLGDRLRLVLLTL